MGRTMLGTHRVEQVAAVDAEVVEAMRIEVEKAFEGEPLASLGLRADEQRGDETDRIEGRSGGRRPLARKHERHESSPMFHDAWQRAPGGGGNGRLPMTAIYAQDSYSSNK